MERRGAIEAWGCGLLGVIIFSGSLPATRVGVAGFSPLFLTSARATFAALLAALVLRSFGQPRPLRSDLPSLSITAIGVVIGFPLLTALALRHVTSAHSIVFIGLLPLATACFAVLRAGERPSPVFWFFSCLGSATVVGFALFGGSDPPGAGDLLMVAAVLLCGLGYAEGAVLSRRIGGWQVISWALVLAAPVMLILALVARPTTLHGVPESAWVGLAYVSLFSMLIGFVFWYRGLAMGGIARVGQLQLLQPFLGLTLAALLLGETVGWPMIAAAGVVVFCVACVRKFG